MAVCNCGSGESGRQEGTHELVKRYCCGEESVLSLSISAGFLEAHVLVGGQESHELWHLDDLDPAGKVNIEVFPGLIEESVQVLVKRAARESLVGVENLLSSSHSVFLAHPELASWLATGLGSIVVLNDFALLLVSIGLDHGSHENVISVCRESWGNDSLVNGRLIQTDWEGVESDISLSLNIFFVFGVRGGAVTIAFILLEIVGSVWWSSIGLLSGPVSVPNLESRLVLLRVGTGEIPNLRGVIGSDETKEHSVNQLHCFYSK